MGYQVVLFHHLFEFQRKIIILSTVLAHLNAYLLRVRTKCVWIAGMYVLLWRWYNSSMRRRITQLTNKIKRLKQFRDASEILNFSLLVLCYAWQKYQTVQVKQGANVLTDAGYNLSGFTKKAFLFVITNWMWKWLVHSCVEWFDTEHRHKQQQQQWE